jgi:hypothetical protein
MADNDIIKFQWAGSQKPDFDEPYAHTSGQMSWGAYGGNTKAGADKNEDGALFWSDPNHKWEFAMILDGHNTSESVQILLDAVNCHQSNIIEVLNEPLTLVFARLQQYVLEILSSIDTSSVQGEASCLIFARKDCYLWWLNVGDCVLYLFHPEYSKLGQYAVNQRSFFEWIGEVNTFSQTVPCYAMGIKQLRRGKNVILAITDGILECGNRPFQNPEVLYRTLYGSPMIEPQILQVLRTVHSEKGADSATAIAWTHVCHESGPFPSNHKEVK